MTQQAPSQEMRSKIAALYDLPSNKVEESSGGFSWTKDGVAGNFITEHPFNLKYPPAASLEFTERPPSTQQVLECLGTPDMYLTWYHAPAGAGYRPILDLDLYFVQRGIRARVAQLGERNRPPRLDGTNPVVELYYVEPDSREKTLEQLTLLIAEERKAKIKPWPGRWEDLVIDIDPSLRSK
ncbi:MAG TPA: hypothetical protein VFD70_08570 [Anaerolineae bacterium]|nr:hypothetical protein [Anaerolineae bacterium]